MKTIKLFILGIIWFITPQWLGTVICALTGYVWVRVQNPSGKCVNYRIRKYTEIEFC